MGESIIAGSRTKELIETARENSKQMFLSGERRHNVKRAIEQYSRDIDNIICRLIEKLGLSERKDFAVVAVGGYGRFQLFPYSDIDILFLVSADADTELGGLIERVLRELWDTGLQIGHAVRSVDETMLAIEKDHTILTAMIDARLVCGDGQLYGELRQRLEERRRVADNIRKFVDDKLRERDARVEKSGDSRYILEPNIKDGKGGLRDLQMLHWLSCYSYGSGDIKKLVKEGKLTTEEYRSFKRSIRFLWLVRFYLHIFSDRAEERLTFDMQRRIAEAMGYRGDSANQSVERFMKRYFQVVREVGKLVRIFCANLEERQQRIVDFPIANIFSFNNVFSDFTIANNRINFAGESSDEITAKIRKKPYLMMKLFSVACEHGLNIHPSALQVISRNLSLIDSKFRRDKVVCELFVDILLNVRHGSPTLRVMSDTDILAKFIPDFARITGQMQFDMYHIYTVDEHTIVALSVLHRIERGKHVDDLPLASQVVRLIHQRRALYVALFCHDIAKGRGGNHEEEAVPITRKIAKRLGLDREEIDTACWLVRNQSLFLDTAFKRDSSDIETIKYMAREVSSVERLRLLLLLSVADLRAVGPKVWNGWKGALMRDLYNRTENYIKSGEFGEVHKHKQQVNIDSADIEEMVKIVERDKGDYAINIDSNEFLDITELTIVARNRTDLISNVTAAISLAGVNIVGAKLSTTGDDIAIQKWQLQDVNKKALMDSYRIEDVKGFVENAIRDPSFVEEKRDMLDNIIRSGDNSEFRHILQIFFDNKSSAENTIIEISGTDRIGFLHAICSKLQKYNINIESAHISNYGTKAVDVLYVKDRYGMKITDGSLVRKIREDIAEIG